MTLGEEFTSNSTQAPDVSKVLETFKTSQKPSQEEAIILLQSRNALNYFKFNVDQYCDLHRLIISESNSATELLTFLKHENTFQKAIRSKEEFGFLFLQIILPALIEKCCSFEEKHEVFESASEITAKCVFSSRDVWCFLTDHFENKKCSEKHSLCKALLKFLISLDTNAKTSQLGFKLIFHSYSKKCRDFGDIYKMFVVLSEVIGFQLKETFNFSKIKYLVPKPQLSGSLAILNELLDVVTHLQVDTTTQINNVTFFDFIKNLISSIMSLSQTPNSHCYQIFLKTIEINPLIIESIINETLVYIMLADNTNCRNEYAELMIKILEVFSKLHRIQNLIAKMIPTLKTAIGNKTLHDAVYIFRGDIDFNPPDNNSCSVDEILPEVVLDYFTSCIVTLASWQVINLFKTLLFHLGKAVEELADGKGESVYIEILSSLTSWLLLSVRMAEHTVAATTVEKFIGGLEELKTILAKFGTTLLQREHNHILMRAFLNVSYYWAEIYMTLEYYSPNKEIKMEKNSDNISPCNIAYLHPYLNENEWSLISERINNFGERPCKTIMQRLLIQKLRAFLIFNDSNNDDVVASIIRTLSSEFDAESPDIFLDEFVVNNILNKMPTVIVMSLAEIIVKDLVHNNTKLLHRPHIYDSQLITNSILCVIFARLNKLLKQKRKHDDTALRKALLSRAISTLPNQPFLENNVEEFFPNITEVINSDLDSEEIDFKMQQDKIELFLDILTKTPVLFCTENAQKLAILLLVALHRDLHHNREDRLKRKCESIIISMVQHNRLTLLDLFEPTVLIKILIDYFDRCEDLFAQIIQNVFKNDELIVSFEPGIAYLGDNLKDEKCLKCATVVLNVLVKIKKTKVSADSKEVCSKYKSTICGKLVKRMLKNKPENRFIEAYALVLKSYLAKDENEGLAKLRGCLVEYMEHCLSNACDANIRECALLFATVLHNKATLSEVNDGFLLRIWDGLKAITTQNNNFEEYSQLVMLVTSLIPNEQFSKIFSDLLKTTAVSIDSGDAKEFCQHLKTWSCLLSTNFNSTKTNILREQLEFLLEKLLLVLKSTGYKQDFEEVIQFEISIIQANHVPLTASIMDFLLSSVPTLLMNKSHDFVHCFSSSVSLLENLLKYRNALIMDRLPPYLLQYRLLLKELCLQNDLQPNEGQTLADCAHKLEKLTKNLVECTKDMSRIAMYLIADILAQYELYTLYPNVKKHLNNCLFSLISLCDQHAVQYLMRVLSEASTEIFKILYKDYKKYHRFTGKV